MKHTTLDHLRMMKTCSRWSAMGGFLLPLKHRTRRGIDGTRLLGFMLVDPTTHEAAPVVYVGLMYFASMGQHLEDLPTEVFPSLEAVVANGWEVD